MRVDTPRDKVAVPALNFAALKHSGEKKPTASQRIAGAGFTVTNSNKVAVPRLNLAILKSSSDDFEENDENIADFKKEYKSLHSGTLETMDTLDAISEGNENASIVSSDSSWCTGSFAMSQKEGATKTFAMSEACGSFVTKGSSPEAGRTPSFFAMTDGGNSFYALTEGINSFVTKGSSFCAMFDKFQQQYTKLNKVPEDPWAAELQLLDYHFS